jgi:uncharacterized protein YprB with RNaseH-like and TPR domain
MGLPPDVFKRLSQLNRAKPLADKVTTADRFVPAPAGDGEAALPATLDAMLPGRERQAGGGRFYHVQRDAADVHPAAGADREGRDRFRDFLARYERLFHGAGVAGPPEDLSETLRPLLAVDPHRILYLDIETCGLAGEPLFLIGLMRADGRTLRVDQYLARDYSEEAAVLHAFWDDLGESRCLVTFNGRAFDVPTIEARTAAARIRRVSPLSSHVDLLHEARRRWKRTLPNCRLQTLEQTICGRWRSGDIPGSDIPAAYHEFVRARQGDDAVRRARSLRRLQTILHHNALDLVTMAELIVHILGHTEEGA